MLSTNPALLGSPDFILPVIYPTSSLSKPSAVLGSDSETASSVQAYCGEASSCGPQAPDLDTLQVFEDTWLHTSHAAFSAHAQSITT